jgi:hypothetical protein
MPNLDDFYNFKPNSEKERRFIEQYSGLSKTSSKLLRSLPEERRLPELRAAEPNNTSLMSHYLWALRQEDYEVCRVAQILLLERGITDIPS